MNVPASSNDRLCALEVDLEYPKELHDLHNDYPLAPESTEVPQDWLSPWQREVCPEYKSYKKLILNLHDKEEIHSALQKPAVLYLKHGMRLNKDS